MEYPGQSAGADALQQGGNSARILLAGVVACLLAFNCAGFYAGAWQGWSAPVVLAGLLLVFTVANALLLPAGLLSLANIFLTLLFLFHMGYYVPVRLGIIRPLPYMPPVFGDAAGRSALVFCAALFALEFGYLVAASRAYSMTARIPCKSSGEWMVAARYSGWIITALSFVSLMIFMTQAGGVAAALQLSYTSLFAFFHASDPRFAFTAMWFAPQGLLLWRAGLMSSSEPPGNERRLWWMAAVFLLFPFLLIGARGPCFLFVLGCVYLPHARERRYRVVHLCVLTLLLALVASAIVSFRNLGPSERLHGLRRWRFDPLAPVLETGSSYRPYVGTLEMLDSRQQEFLNGQSYLIAVGSLIPNLGSADNLEPSGYYRTSAWFNYRLSPRDEAAGVGIGCSIIAEQYANFGYFGVVSVFAAIGAMIVSLELRAIFFGSTLARGVLAILVIPLCWYIRDDIFGCVRVFVWPLALLLLVRICRMPLLRSAQNSESASVLSGGEG